MPVFTVFCHGTSEHRAKGDPAELIHALSAKAAGREYDDFLILDGPGAGNKTDPMAGSFDAFDRHKGLKKNAPAYSRTNSDIMDMSNWKDGKASTWKPSTLQQAGSAIGNLYSGGAKGVAAGIVGTLLSPLVVPAAAVALKANDSLRGLVFGEGMDDNIRHAMAAMGNKWTDFNGVTVNMVGWSRGAVTCIRMANWINEFYGPGVNINIFAVDPVAGGDLGTAVADTYTIPANVKKFVAMIAMDDKRGGFRPQDIHRLVVQDKTSTQMALLPLPGAHDTPVKLGGNADYPEVAECTRYLAYKFLLGAGTVFKNAETVYLATQLCDKYALIKTKAVGYDKLGEKGVSKAAMGGIISRDIHLDSYISHSPAFFVNEHHVECFKLAFPQVYQLFFSASPPVPAGKAQAQSHSVPAASALGRDLQRMHQASEASSHLLMSLGMLQRRTAGVMGTGPAFWTVKPAGLYQGDNGAMRRGRAMLRTLIG